MDEKIPGDPATLALMELAAAIAGAGEERMQLAVTRVLAAAVPPTWVDELLLQSVLMVGWPRALAAAGAWRSMSGIPAPADDPDAHHRHAAEWAARGEDTCRVIYGSNYERLRDNVRGLHPALDLWMVTEGYGKVLSRRGLDPRRRELCTVAQCAVQGAMPQLHSHLRGAVHTGATAADLAAALAAAEPWMSPAGRNEAHRLLGLVTE